MEKELKCLYCITGPSGSGKTTLAELLEEQFNFRSVPSYTTRPPRYAGEKGHLFITESEFSVLQDMVAYTKFGDFEYGVTRGLLSFYQTYVIDLEGIKTLRQKYTEKPICVIGLYDEEDIRKKRMLERGDSEEQAERRLQIDRVMYADLFNVADVLFFNETMSCLVDLAVNIIKTNEKNLTFFKKSDIINI